jgi:flagellar hook-basal body complex protein FliE
MITPFAAAKAYAAAQKGVGLDAGLDSATTAAPAQGGFGDLLKSAISDAMATSKVAERQMANQVAGKAELVDVVTAITSAETSLETIMSIRDQAISAYQEIIRMPI